MRTPLATRLATNGTAYVVTVVFLLPVYVLINLAIRPPGDVTPALVPSPRATFENFINGWTQSTLPGAILTSAFVTTVSLIAILVLATMAAYPLARSTARLSSATFYTFMIGLLLPFQLAMLPLYFQMRDIGLIGNVWSLVLIYAGGSMPFSVFLITTFLRSSVPTDYEEAARIDGCTNIQVFFYIVVPLLRPILGTCIILNGVSIWNDFFTPLIYLAGGGQQTIPMSLYQFVGIYSTNWPLIFASLLISMVPILTLYLLFQRYVIQGFAGGIKG
jgi:raffinose/stachyose/melibiose transport system permease protein